MLVAAQTLAQQNISRYSRLWTTPLRLVFTLIFALTCTFTQAEQTPAEELSASANSEYETPELSVKKGLDDLEKARSLSNGILEARALQDMGNGYFNLSLYSKALEQYLAAATLYQKHRTFHALAATENSIGNIFTQLGNFEQSEIYYQRALDNYSATGDKSGVAGVATNIGVSYEKQGDFNKALKQYQKTMDFSQEAGLDFGIAISHLNMGDVYLTLGNYGQAIEHANTDHTIFRQLNNSYYLCSSLTQLAALTVALQNPEGACNNLPEAEIIEQPINKQEISKGIDKGKSNRNSKVH